MIRSITIGMVGKALFSTCAKHYQHYPNTKAPAGGLCLIPCVIFGRAYHIDYAHIPLY